jgi:hypothetical protein
MCHEHRDLVEDLRAALVGLFPRGRNADYDVPQDALAEMSELAFTHGECEDIGRSIFMTIELVQLMDALIVS